MTFNISNDISHSYAPSTHLQHSSQSDHPVRTIFSNAITALNEEQKRSLEQMTPALTPNTTRTVLSEPLNLPLGYLIGLSAGMLILGVTAIIFYKHCIKKSLPHNPNTTQMA